MKRPAPVNVLLSLAAHPRPQSNPTGAARRSVRLVALAAFIIAFALPTAPALAQSGVKVLSKFNEWTATTYPDENGGKVCSMHAFPISTEEGGKKRGEVAFFVTHRPDKNQDNIASIVMGYPLEEGVDPIGEIKGATFPFESVGGFAYGYEEEKGRLIASMRAGSRMVISGISTRGTATRDVYSLSGFTAAYRSISEACGVSS